MPMLDAVLVLEDGAARDAEEVGDALGIPRVAACGLLLDAFRGSLVRRWAIRGHTGAPRYQYRITVKGLARLDWLREHQPERLGE